MLNSLTLVIELLIAFGALGALWYARKTFESNKLARRSILAPKPTHGYCKVGNDKKFKSISFSLTNYGINPAYKVRGEIHCYDIKSVINNEEYPQLPFWSQDCYQTNPLPYKGEWKIEYLCEHSFSCDYLIFMVSYMDEALNKRFSDTFYWKVDNERLIEVSAGNYRNMVALAKHVEKNRHDLGSVPGLYGEEEILRYRFRKTRLPINK